MTDSFWYAPDSVAEQQDLLVTFTNTRVNVDGVDLTVIDRILHITANAFGASLESLQQDLIMGGPDAPILNSPVGHYIRLCGSNTAVL
jgi:hypothetical protein